MSGIAHTDDPPPPRLARAAHAAEELCATLWEAMHEELRRPRESRVLELSERLAQVCAAVGALVEEDPAPVFAPSASELATSAPVLAPSASELESSASELESSASVLAPSASELEPCAPPPISAPEIAIHDIRREGPSALRSLGASEEGRTAWASAIGESLERHAADGLPFAALLIEMVGVEWIAQAEPPAGLGDLRDRVEAAIRPELRPSDVIVRESPGRWWLMASRTDLRGARTLAERLARTVRSAAEHRGQPLEVAIGVAACPDDGEDAAALAAHADVGLYAARAAGQPVAPPENAA